MGRIAFSLGPLNVYWYGLIIAVAVFIGLMVSLWQAKIRQVAYDKIVDLVLYGVVAGIIVARVYYVLFNRQLYLDNLLESLMIWHGGLAIHGALLGWLAAVYTYCHVHGLEFWSWADILAPGTAIGQAIGQWGNFINQEAFGYPTDKPWGIYIDFAYRPPGYEQYDFFHPTFLYESIWNLVIFVVLLITSALQRKYKKLASGSIFLVQVLLYSMGKIVIEAFRLDSEWLWGLRLGQVGSGIAIALALYLLIVRNRTMFRSSKQNA